MATLLFAQGMWSPQRPLLQHEACMPFFGEVNALNKL